MATAESVTVDLTTCPICLTIFDIPKSLPCLHAFCLKCLQGYFKDKCPGDGVICPMCRKGFRIPSEGLDGLQHHFFVQRLVDFRRTSGEEFDNVSCEVCSGESYGDWDKIPTATMCCVDCNQKLCEQCSRPHRRMRGGAHQVKPLGAEVEQELIQLRGSSCDKHKDKQVELYCSDCNENICLMCSAVNHRNHKSSEIHKASEEFRSAIDDDDKNIEFAISALRKQSEQTKQKALNVRSEMENVKKKVLAAGDEIKRLVDDQISQILNELELVMSESGKQAASVEETYQLALVSMESFHRYSRELLDKGRPSDITRAACELHDRATELLGNDVTAVKYRPPYVTFTPADVTQIKRLNLIGKVAVNTGNYPGTPPPPVLRVEMEGEQEVNQQLKQANDTAARLQDELRQAADRESQLRRQLDKTKDDVTRLQTLQKEFGDFKQSSAPLWEKEMKTRDMGRVMGTLPEGEPVWGVTSLDNHLYLLRGNKSSEQIEVYDIDSCRLLRCFTVRGLAYDIVVCGHNRCAYVSDASQNSVHRLALTTGAAIAHWPVYEQPYCLSVSTRYSVLVTCRRVGKIKEFSAGGKLLCEVVLPQDVCTLQRAVQLSSGELILCHGDTGDPLHRVCLVGYDGRVVKSFGGSKGSGGQQMNAPAHMALDRNEFIFVTDVKNNRVLLLSPTLTYLRDVASRKQLQWCPYRLSVDVKRRRLYVAVNEYKDGKFTVGRVTVVSM